MIIALLISLFLLLGMPMMGQTPQVVLPEDGNWPTIVGDSIMLIGPKQEALTEEQRYFNPPYLIVYPGKEHLKEQMIRAALCDCDPTKPNRRIGVFSVAPDKQVSFSQGNLQYLPAANIWKFADTQYEYLGNANKYLTPTFRNWVDLFGWSANNTTAPFGISTSMSASDYAGDFVDWGVNAICGDAPGTWRTLSVDEWGYLFQGRKNATQLYSKGNIDGLRGMIILPDNWVMPEGLHFTAQPTNLTMELDINTYTQAEWLRMEEAGAVFLCPTGRRDGTKIDYLEYYGGYWSSSKISNSNHVCHMYYNYKSKIFMTDYKEGDYSYGTNGRAVRLVHDTIVPETIPDPCLVVKVNDTLSINMMCVEGGTFTMGQGENAHPVSLSSYSICQTEVTQALWEAVMGTNPSANTTNKELPVTNVSWYDCQAFIKKLNQLTGMRFRLPTEAEWEYAARGGQMSKGYTYAGSKDLKEVAWYNGNSGNTLHPVAQKKPNELGIYDMSGNAWEWCHDWHAPYPTTHQYNPLGPEVGKVVGKRYLRVFRGGSYGYEAAYHQNAFRDITGPEPNIGTSNLGLRLVLSDEVNFQTIHVNDTLSFHMMDVKGGTFTMGDNNTSNASPAHHVTLSDYYIGETEVTQALWKSVMGNIPTGNKNPYYPVGYVTYADCQNFIAKLNNLTGLHFQLPTEAEWEYAAMGGNMSHGYLYSGSNTIDDVAWYDQNSENKMHNVGAKQPNELGIYDMSGNAWEWCADYYDKYTADPKNDPKGPTTGTGRVIRSGSFRTTAERCSNKHRQAREADYPDSHITLRLVLHDTEPAPEPEYVDLGLSVKWATFNVGATSPEDYGDYFAWGETEPKETYSWATYKWCDGTSSNMTKYNATDGKTILEPEDDAAQVNWGEDWRMPSDEEFTELREKCTWTWTTQDGVKGYKITGPSGNSIFIPAAGFHYENGFNYGENGDYWSAQAGLPNNGKHLNFYPNKQINSTSYRYFGFPIRPVYDDRPTLTVIPTPEDAKVSFLCIGYQAQGHSITVDKGKNVLYQVSNVDAGYLSQGDSIYNLTKDTTLYVTLRPFSDGNWVKVDKSEYTKQEGYYVSRNNGGFASHSVWNYYVLPVLPGETYRVRGIAGQHAALWMAASTAPDPATNTRPTKISCCANRGVAAYVADEVTIPDGAKYLIINSRNGKEMMVERKVPDPCLVVKVNDTLSINLMCVEGGTFMMGAMEGDTQAKENEKPAHEVTLTYDYLIMQTEVTQGLWEAVMGEDIYDLISKSPTPNAKPISTKGDFPVGYVQLSQCLEFIDRLNELTGMHFRMPTEAEWEYAARGGNQSKGYLYAGSNTLTQVAQTSLGTVAKLLPNELGIYDMSGNIAEMTLDYLPNHETGYPSANAQVNPRQISPTGNRAIRGLRWNTTEINCRISHRNAYTTTYSGNGMGFRLVLSEEQDFRTIHVNGSYFDMSFVKGGTFMMGSDAPDAQADEQPVHEVTLSDYYIGQTEVTQHLWQKVMGDDNNPSTTKGNNLPVTNITWDEAQQFVERLSEMTGLRFRLPTEAEWEYAARGGQKSKGYTYAGSDNIDEVGWYNGNSSNKTHAVGQKQPNELGIYDMTGNIWEYCFDWHTPYSTQAQTNPTGAATGEKHVLRGGCYHYDSKNCTNTNRHSYYTPDKGGASTGLRIVLEPQRYYRYGYTQEDWDAATSSWGHAGRGHAPADQSCIQGTMVHGIRLKVAKAGSLNVYKVPSLLEKNEDHFELVATLTTDSTGLQDFDFAEPIYIAPNEYLVFGKPSEEEPTLRPCYINISRAELPAKAKGFAHYIGTEKAKVIAPNGSLMVEFY